ncbi:hypothetical protein DPMN_128602 [Dreissena polymorpha]|uniref:Uncharacterized protein n=1 Tax=Dreissena polymorpha TaxID=45954 RepID=A0A9D4H1I3_DREPO|nr:hypothetical protein DPMN_128602 [Dreissena polymorpha]
MDRDSCAVGCVGHAHLALPSVDDKAQCPSCILLLHLLLGVGEKIQIIGNVNAVQLFPMYSVPSPSRYSRPSLCSVGT